MTLGKNKRLSLSRKGVRPVPADFSHREFDAEEDFFPDPISIGVQFDERCGKVIELQPRPIHNRQPLEHREEILHGLRAPDQAGAQHLSVPVAE